jgi:defect-in-organelle-trafficking protein DotD
MKHITKRRITPAPLMLALFLVGCAIKPPAEVTPDSEAYARQLILERVDAAVLAQRELAASTVEGRQQVLRRQAALDVDEVDIDYLGKPQPLLEAVAFRYGYRYVETGKRDDLKTINIRVTKRPVVEVLRDVGYQIDAGADVVLDKDAKILRLIYKKG